MRKHYRFTPVQDYAGSTAMAFVCSGSMITLWPQHSGLILVATGVGMLARVTFDWWTRPA